MTQILTASETIARFPSKLKPLFQPFRYKIVRGGRGSGKSWNVARALLVLGTNRPLRILCTREIQESIAQSVHQLLVDQIGNLGLGAFYEPFKTELRGKNGTKFLFRGLSDVTADSIKSFEGVDIVWIEEGQSITDRSLKVLIPTIRKDGSEIWITYNPVLDTDPVHVRAMNLPPNSVSIEINYSDNPWFPPVLEQERLHDQRLLPEHEYAHIWLGRTLPAVEGAIYVNEVNQAEINGQFGRVPYDPALKVHTIWDMGWSDAMAIIFVQRAASEIRIIDYIEDNHLALDKYVAMLKERPYNYGIDYMPHDAFAVRHQTGKSDAEVMQANGRTVERVPDHEVEAGLRLCRLTFPRVWFNAKHEGVATLIECLRRYRRHISRSTGAAGSPVHDDYSHGADAFRYLCQVADQLPNFQQVKLPDYKAGGNWMG